MTQTTLIAAALLDEVSQQARDSRRRRKNFNFHLHETDPCNRLLNAVEPDSYVRPHRHLDATKDETIVVLRGSFGVVFFDQRGAVMRSLVICAGGDSVGVNIAHGQFHTLVALTAGSVLFEAKAGPYAPMVAEELAPWAPAEGDPASPAYLEKLRGLFDFQLAD